MTGDTALIGLSEGLIDLVAKVGDWALRRFLGERGDDPRARFGQHDVNPAGLETPASHGNGESASQDERQG
jgi:hypothetical protein